MEINQLAILNLVAGETSESMANGPVRVTLYFPSGEEYFSEQSGAGIFGLEGGAEKGSVAWRNDT